MRKKIAVLCSMLILLLSCQAVSAVELTGSLEAIGIVDNAEFNVNMGFKLNMNLVEGDEQQVSLQMELVPDTKGSLGDFFPVKPGAGYPKVNALLTTRGQFLNAGPVLTTRIGQMSVKYSDYVGVFSNLGAIEISGGRIGDLRISGLYAFDGDVKPLALRLAGDVDRIQVNGTYVRVDEDQLAFHFGASTQVNERVTVAAQFANDKVNGNAYNVNGRFKVVNGVYLKAGLWNFGDFDSPYINAELKNLYGGKTDGKELGLEVNLAGVTVNGAYMTFDQGGKNRQLMDLQAQRDLMGITAGIKAQYDIKAKSFITNELTLSKVFSIPGYFENVSVTGKYDFEEAELSLVQVEYTSPNRIKWTFTSTPENPKRLTAAYKIEF